MAYKSLSTANLPDPAIDPAQDVEPRDYFETFLYSGNGGGLQVGDVIKKPADTITISNSLIFNQSDTAYLSRTPSASTETNSATTFTVSCWFKPTLHPNDYQTIWMASTGDATVDRIMLRYNSSADDGKLLINNDNGFGMTTTAALKDTGRWYHIVVAVDTRSSVTQSDRVKVWIDGVLQSLTVTTAASADETTKWNQNYPHKIGDSTYYSGRNLDGYLAEFHNIDGIAYTADDFGTFDANGIWIPKTPSVTYGDNGFHLDFADSSALGDDESGNANDWTANNFATTDQVPDSPTNSYPIFSGSNRNSGTQLSEGNLEFRNTSGQIHNSAIATRRLPKQGKWYWEVKVITDSSPATNAIGVASASFDNTPTPSGAGNFFYNEGLGWYGNTGGLFGPATYGDEVESGSATTFGNNDIIGVEYDADEKTMFFRKNGTLIDYHYVNLKDSTYDFLPATSAYGDLAGNGTRGNIINFGQKTLYGTDGAGTIPTGFSLLTENNITVDDQNLESPDFVWIKCRDNTRGHLLFDSVRGIQRSLRTNTNGAEDTSASAQNTLTSFNANGFTIGSDSDVNTSGEDFVAWNWKAGTSFNNSAGTNGASIASSGSANTTSGFSIVSYTGDSTGTDGTPSTVAHGLSQAPEMIMFKPLDTYDGAVYHSGLTSASYRLILFSASGTLAQSSDTGFFNGTAPTSSVFSIGSRKHTNSNGGMIAYCFHSVEGFSKFGSYEGTNNADGPFIYLGFRPKFFLLKNVDSALQWIIFDDERDPYNAVGKRLFPATTNGDSAVPSNLAMDFLSNGVKIKIAGGYDINDVGTYIYMAFAENPFKYSNAR